MAKTKKRVAAKVSKTSATDPTTSVEASVEASVEVPVQTETPDGAQLTIADLQALASVIDVAVRRGTFGASEVTEVGAIFDKLSAFLKIIATQKEAADKAAGASLTEASVTKGDS